MEFPIKFLKALVVAQIHFLAAGALLNHHATTSKRANLKHLWKVGATYFIK